MSFLNNLITTNATAIAVGPSGSTNPVFLVDCSVASAATGVKATGRAAAAGTDINAVSSGTNEDLRINAKGTGKLGLQSAATGILYVGPAANPAFQVDPTAGSAATGAKVTAQAAGSGVAIAATSSGTNEAISLEGKGSGAVNIGGVSTGPICLGRGGKNALVVGNTLTSIATQNSTPTAAQLLGGIIEHASTTGAGTATLDTGANLSTAVPGVTVGDTFEVIYDNTGTQTVTITTNTGLTLKGTVAIPSGKTAFLCFRNTGSNAWTVYCSVSA